jgi:amino-acid N-acetyltransferase
MSIQPAGPSDLPAIVALLRASDLPAVGLESTALSALVARQSGRLVGCAAIEIYGPAGLLRSVCVERSIRGSGLGRRLVEAAEAEAARRGVRELFLLTETASEWFPRLGYVEDVRDAAPDSVRSSPEFTDVCPESARLFHKRLAG